MRRYVYPAWGWLGAETQITEFRHYTSIQLDAGRWEGVAIGTASEHDLVYVEGEPLSAFAKSGFRGRATVGPGAPLIVPTGRGEKWAPTIIAARGSMLFLASKAAASRDVTEATRKMIRSQLEVVLFGRACDAMAYPARRAGYEQHHALTIPAGEDGSIFVPFAGRRHAVISARHETGSSSDVELEVHGWRVTYDEADRGGNAAPAVGSATVRASRRELTTGNTIAGGSVSDELLVVHVGGTDNAESFEMLEVRIDNGDASSHDISIHVEAWGELGG